MSIAKASVLFVIAAILAHPYVDGAHEQLEVPRQNARSGERRPSIGLTGVYYYVVIVAIG